MRRRSRPPKAHGIRFRDLRFNADLPRDRTGPQRNAPGRVSVACGLDFVPQRQKCVKILNRRAPDEPIRKVEFLADRGRVTVALHFGQRWPRFTVQKVVYLGTRTFEVFRPAESANVSSQPMPPSPGIA